MSALRDPYYPFSDLLIMPVRLHCRYDHPRHDQQYRLQDLHRLHVILYTRHHLLDRHSSRGALVFHVYRKIPQLIVFV